MLSRQNQRAFPWDHINKKVFIRALKEGEKRKRKEEREERRVQEIKKKEGGGE